MPVPFASTAVASARSAAAQVLARAPGVSAEASVNDAARLRSFRQIVQSRVSARRFEPNMPVPDRVWCDTLRMTITSPSGFNLQPTHMILVRSPLIKSALSKHAMLGFGNQYRAIDASGITVFCADLEPSKRINRVFQMERESGAREGGYMAVLRVAGSFLTGASTTTSFDKGQAGVGSSTRLSTFLKRAFTDALSPVQPMPTMECVESWSYKNAGIAAQTYTLAATAHGLSTCMMEGFDARRAREILRVPDRYGIPLMVATGYNYGVPPVVHAELDDWDNEYEVERNDELGTMPQKRTPRLEMNELCFGDTFGEKLDLILDGPQPSVEEDIA